MKTPLFAITLALAGLGFTTQAATRTVKLDVANMSCVTCPLTVKTALKRVPGVQEVKVSFETKQAVVTFDDTKVSVTALRKTTADVGFPSTPSK